MNKKIISLALFLAASASYAQVGIGTLDPDATTQLEVKATDKGVLIPRVVLKAPADPSPITKENSVAAAASDLQNGLLVYNTATTTDLAPGFYFWQDNAWIRVATPADVQAAITAAGDNDTKITAFAVAGDNLTITVQNGSNPTQTFSVPVADLATVLGQDLTSDTSIEVTGGAGAVLVASNIKVKDGGIASNHLAAGSVTPDKLDSGSTTPGLIPVSNADGTVTYVSTIPATSLPAEGNGTLSGNDQINVTNGAGALFHDASLSIKENSITADQIATGAVTTDEIADNTITPADILGATANDGKVLTTVNGVVEWATPSVSADNITDGKALTSADNTITVAGDGATAGLLKAADIKVSENAITTAHIANGTIKPEDIFGEAANNGKVLTTVNGTVQWEDNPAVVNYTKDTIAETTGTVVIDGTTYKIKRVVKVVPINSTVLGSGNTAIGANRGFTLQSLGLTDTQLANIVTFKANGGGHSIAEFKVVDENLVLNSGNMSKAYPSGNYTVVIEFYEQ